MTNNDEKIERVIGEALALFERGVPQDEIMRRYAGYEAELKGVFDAIEAARQGGKAVLPNRKLLATIIERVTERGAFGYSYQGVIKGRTSTREILSEISNTLMSWKTWVPIGVVAAAVIVFVITQFGGTDVSGLSMRDIEDEADALDGLMVASDLQGDLEFETGLSGELDFALTGDSGAAAAATPTAGGAAGAQDPLGLGTIQNEASAVGFGSDFDSFFSSEGGVNSALSDL